MISQLTSQLRINIVFGLPFPLILRFYLLASLGLSVTSCAICTSVNNLHFLIVSSSKSSRRVVTAIGHLATSEAGSLA